MLLNLVPNCDFVWIVSCSWSYHTLLLLLLVISLTGKVIVRAALLAAKAVSNTSNIAPYAETLPTICPKIISVSLCSNTQRFRFDFYLWLNKVLANERRRYKCYVSSHWLSLCSSIDRQRTQDQCGLSWHTAYWNSLYRNKVVVLDLNFTATY